MIPHAVLPPTPDAAAAAFPAASLDMDEAACDLTIACAPGTDPAFPTTVDQTATTALDLASSCPRDWIKAVDAAVVAAAAASGGPPEGGRSAEDVASGLQPKDLMTFGEGVTMQSI